MFRLKFFRNSYKPCAIIQFSIQSYRTGYGYSLSKINHRYHRSQLPQHFTKRSLMSSSFLSLYQNTGKLTFDFKYLYEPSETEIELKRWHRSESSVQMTYPANEKQRHVLATNDLLHFLQTNAVLTKDDVMSCNHFLISASKHGHDISKVTRENCFNRFLKQMELHIVQMSPDELMSSLIALILAGLPLHHRNVRTIIIQISDKLKDAESSFSLRSLANLATFAHQHSDHIYPYFLCADATLRILDYLDRCENLNELHYIALYLHNMRRSVTKDLLTAFKTKLKNFTIESEIQLKDEDLKPLLGILDFLNLIPWSPKNTRIIRNMVQLFTDKLSSLSTSDLQKIAYIYKCHAEPALISPLILEIAESHPEKSTNLDILYCRLTNELPENAELLVKEIECVLDQIDAHRIIYNTILFQTIRDMKYTSKKIHHKYWEKVTKDLLSMDSRHTDFCETLSIIAYRYCHFNNNVHGVYRYTPFETVVKELALNDIKHGMSGLSPKLLASLSTFIIGYAPDQPGTHGWKELPEYFVQKIEAMAPQFNVTDCLRISHGLEICNGVGFPKSLSKPNASKFATQLCRIENVVNECTERILEWEVLRVDLLSMLIKAYSSRKTPKQTSIFDKLINRFEQVCASDDLIITSRSIRQITVNLNKIHYAIPRLCERMLNYVNEERDNISGEIVARVLYSLYSLGYQPNSEIRRLPDQTEDTKLLDAELFDFEQFVRIISRDFNLMPGLFIVRASLALSFYHALPLELINRIFDINFIVRLEKEISMCYNKATYPQHALGHIMQLNRSVCFNYPEAGVPWFQQNFIETQIAAQKPKNSRFYDGIYKMLVSFLGDKNLIKLNHVTPYGYRIPFVIYYNSDNQFVYPPNDEGSQSLNKVAILPLQNKSYCLNKDKRLRGEQQLQERHLGMLGYRVVQIGYRDWNSMYMNLPGAREEFLKKYLRLEFLK